MSLIQNWFNGQLLLAFSPALGFIASPSLGFAANADESTMTIGAGGGLQTYKSKTADSNDTAIATTYGLEVLAGQNESLLVMIRNDRSKTAFGLNSATMELQEFMGIIGYTSGFLKFGVGGSSGNHKLTFKDGTGFDAAATSAAGLFTLQGELFRSTTCFWSTWVGYPIKVTEATKQTLKLGLSLNTEFGARFSITKKSLKLQSAFGYHTQTITFAGKSQKEVRSSPSLALLWGIDL